MECSQLHLFSKVGPSFCIPKYLNRPIAWIADNLPGLTIDHLPNNITDVGIATEVLLLVSLTQKFEVLMKLLSLLHDFLADLEKWNFDLYHVTGSSQSAALFADSFTCHPAVMQFMEFPNHAIWSIEVRLLCDTSSNRRKWPHARSGQEDCSVWVPLNTSLILSYIPCAATCANYCGLWSGSGLMLSCLELGIKVGFWVGAPIYCNCPMSRRRSW